MFFKIFLYEWIKIFGVKNFATSPIEFLTQFVRVYLICPRMFRGFFLPLFWGLEDKLIFYANQLDLFDYQLITNR